MNRPALWPILALITLLALYGAAAALALQGSEHYVAMHPET